ncbi:MAG: hypothetical protein Q7R49_00480, partial [Candidatus Daviesbacteria bacterium]|nr:hypothetical protein [Candidatus Daviesbacteria bacterium]
MAHKFISPPFFIFLLLSSVIYGILYIMILLKKLIFAPFFLIILGLFFYQLTPLLESYDFIFSLSSDTLIQLITISA